MNDTFATKDLMKWYWVIRCGHTHVRVFMNGAKCGDLCFRNEEFATIRHAIYMYERIRVLVFEDTIPAEKPA